MSSYIFIALVLVYTSLPGGASAQEISASEKTREAVAADEVTVMTFDEIYKKPYGPRGPEYSEKALSLVGKRVKIEGFLVSYKVMHTMGHLLKFSELVHGGCILVPVPVQVTPTEYAECDDLPACAVFLRESTHINSPARAPLYGAVTGLFEAGMGREVDGRTSWLRLTVDTLETATPHAPAAKAASKTLPPEPGVVSRRMLR